MVAADGVDVTRIKLNAEYTLQQLSDTFHYSVSTLRKAVRDGELKARKRGKFIYVLGKNAIAWWNS